MSVEVAVGMYYIKYFYFYEHLINKLKTVVSLGQTLHSLGDTP